MASEHFARHFDGHTIERLCKETLPGTGDEALVGRIHATYPEFPLSLARRGHEWYRLGGVIRSDGSRVAPDLNEWAERTFLECGQQWDTLLSHCESNRLLATRHRGVSLYLVAPTGSRPEQFVQIEIDRSHEVAERYLIDPEAPPEDLEELIDPLTPSPVQPFTVGAPRYAYRRKTDVEPFMAELARHRADRHPAQRFMDDWHASSAGPRMVFCQAWSLRLSEHLGRHGERVMNVEIVPNRDHGVLRIEDAAGRKGKALAAQLARFDALAGYPFAWFFHVVRNLLPVQIAVSVHRDLSTDYAYLPQRDAEVLSRWIEDPYLL
ncbi:MAG: hypothetical protein U1E83_06650 [Methylotetracoccus sp.]